MITFFSHSIIFFSLKRFHICFNIFVLLFFVTLCLAVAVQSCMSESQSKTKKKKKKKWGKGKPTKKKKKKKKKKIWKIKAKKKKKKKKNHISGGTFKAPKASYISYISLKKVIFFKRNFIIIVSIFSIK